MTRRSEAEPRVVDVVEVVTPFAFERDGVPIVVVEGDRLRADDELVKRFPSDWFRPVQLRSP
jgi:hypothetical protein